MKELIRTGNVSYADSVYIALEAHDIPAVLNQSYGPYGGMRGLSGSTVSIVDDADFERAKAVLSEIVETPQVTSSDARVSLWGLLLVFLAVAVWSMLRQG